jgi:dTMP kinase
VSKGLLICFEGIDGSGKTTLSKLLVEDLLALKIPVIYRSQPTDSELGAYIRKQLKLESESLQHRQHYEDFMSCLFAADRYNSLYDPNNGVLKLLKDGVNVVCDRYIASGLAYPNGSIGIPEALNENFPRPDITFYLDLDPPLAVERLNARDVSIDCYESLNELERVYSRYKDICEYLSFTVSLDSSKPIEQLRKLTKRCISNLLSSAAFNETHRY